MTTTLPPRDSSRPALIGSTFPLSLLRRPCHIEPANLDDLKEKAAKNGWISFWGHQNTRLAAKKILGFDPAPESERPALSLDPDLLPTLGTLSFHEVWVLSPDYRQNFRPAIGQEVSPEDILSWQCLKITF